MGLALLELQLVALEFAAAFRMNSSASGKMPTPIASVTLIPPRIDITVELASSDLSKREAA